MFGGFGNSSKDKQGGGGMFGGMMSDMMGAINPGQQQQQQQQQQQEPPQKSGGGGGGMFGGMFGGGGGDAFSSLFTDRDESAPAPDVVPAAASQFKAKARCLFPMMPMVMDTTLYYDFENMRQRVEWPGMGGLGWEVERWDLKYKVKLGGPQEEAEVNELPEDQHQSSYGIVPSAIFEGTEKVGGVECYRYFFDFFGMCQATTWTSIPQSKEDVCVPIFNKSKMMGMEVSMHFSEHDLDFDFGPSANHLFFIDNYIPPKGVPTVVAGYVKDATNNRSVAGAQVAFTPTNGMASTDLMASVTDSNGRFTVTLPVAPGEGTPFNVSYDAQGYSGLLKSDFLVVGCIPAGTFADACLSPLLQAPMMRAVLRWGSHPRDLDIHCTRVSGEKICNYAKKSSPQATLNIDVRTCYGPETMTILNCGEDSHEEDPLVINVHQWSGDGKLWGCGAVVDFYDHTGHCGKVSVPQGGDGAERWWKVASISGGRFQEINTLS